ncbi:MAG TPA: hypothetical protein DD435_10640 [Cyanobacteria bacterium UBA8530]|nr:hypothetical protein [Cyanobacteria bacterium UBA8530]
MTDIRIGATNSLQAIDNWLKILSGNLTGSTVTGYRQVRAEFSDVLTQHISAGHTATNSDVAAVNPLQFNVGGTTLSGTVTDYSQGSIQTTSRPTDLAVQGDSFFTLSKTPNPKSFDDLVYTRNGSFHFDFYPDKSVYDSVNNTGNPYDPNTMASGHYRLVNQDGLFVMGVRGNIQPRAAVTDPKEADIPKERTVVPTGVSRIGDLANLFQQQFANWGDPTFAEGLSAIQVPYCKDQGNNVVLNLDFDANVHFDSNGLLRSGDSFVQDNRIDPATGEKYDLLKFVALTKFTSPDGLIKKTGSTEFLYDRVAGAIFAGIASTGEGTIGAYNNIVSSSLESSNSSVNTALPELTIAQKSFTANVKIISVGNSMMDDINQLIR